jgi:hypothetical protein
VSRALSIAALALALHPLLAHRAAHAQYGGMGGGFGGGGVMPSPAPTDMISKPYPVKVETSGGRSVTGTLNMASVLIMCEFGQYEIMPEKVREVRFTPPPSDQPLIRYQPGTLVPGVVVTRTGEEIQGKVLIPHWKVKTDLGLLTLLPGTLKSLSITGDPKPPGDGQPPANDAQKPGSNSPQSRQPRNDGQKAGG